MSDNRKFYKENETDKIWKVSDFDGMGKILFSFDRETVFNAWVDYPYNMTDEQIRMFDEQFPYWAEFFEDRKNDGEKR